MDTRSLLFMMALAVWGFCPLLALAGGWRESVALSQEPGNDVREEKEVRDTLQRVLSSPEYRRLVRPQKQEKSSQYEMPEWLRRFIDWLFGERRVRTTWWTFLVRTLLTVLALAVVAAVAALIVRQIWDRLPTESEPDPRGHAPGDGLALSQPPGELPCDEYVRRAHQAAGRGDYRAAIRELLLGAMSWTERAGLIRYRRGLTNRDYLRAVRRRREAHTALTEIVAAFEFVFFGRRSATADRFQDCLASYQTGFSSDGSVARTAGFAS
jgi:hypothetical protein